MANECESTIVSERVVERVVESTQATRNAVKQAMIAEAEAIVQSIKDDKFSHIDMSNNVHWRRLEKYAFAKAALDEISSEPQFISMKILSNA